MTRLLSALRWLLRHPTAAIAALGAGLLALYRWRARRAELQRDVAVQARQHAEDTTAATTDALERQAEGARTREDVIYAARTEALAHPDDPEAAARGARDYARARWAGMREAGPGRAGADPVRRDAAPGAATRDGGR